MSEKTGEKTVFTWRDGTVTEASLKQITEGFAGKYGKQKDDLVEVVIGDSAKSLELNAFRLCKNLKKAVISDINSELINLYIVMRDKPHKRYFKRVHRRDKILRIYVEEH